MFDELKYVLDEAGNFMIFSPVTHHKTAFFALERHALETCVGAGFICFPKGKVRCHGRSESLNIRSNGVLDAEVIAKKLGMEAIE